MMPQNGRSAYSKKYFEYLSKYIARHDLLTKPQTILEQLLDKNDLTDTI